jgi:hypothetical protein
MRSRATLMSVAFAVILLMSVMTVAPALDFGSVVKVFGIGYAVKVFGPQINKAINSLLAERGVEWEGTTKVVPIVSLGAGGFIGAAQVAGPPELVGKVKAVAQGELNIGSLNGRALFPIGSTDVKKYTRISGVGLSALVDFRI